MIEQELKNIWKNASKTEQIKLDISKLLIELNIRLKEVNNNIKKRDFREIAAALFGIPLHIYFFYLVPYPITRIGLVFIILWFVYVIIKLRNTAKLSKSIDVKDTYVQQLKQQKNYLYAQAKLLDSTWLWYLLPPFVGNIICIAGVGNPNDYGVDNWLVGELPSTFSEKLSLILVLGVFYGIVFWMNKRASKKNIKPILADIDKIEAELNMD